MTGKAGSITQLVSEFYAFQDYHGNPLRLCLWQTDHNISLFSAAKRTVSRKRLVPVVRKHPTRLLLLLGLLSVTLVRAQSANLVGLRDSVPRAIIALQPEARLPETNR